MIANLKIVDDETATANGEKYDLVKVLDAAEEFLRRFAGMTALSAPAMPRFLRFGQDEIPLDDAGYEVVRAFYVRAARRHDAVDAGVSAIVGPFRVMLKLLGDDDLFLREGESEPVTISDAHWSGLTHEPKITVMPASGANPLFELGSIDAVRALVRAAAPEGTEAVGPNLPGIRFPHAAFGAGTGRLRIALTRVPKEDPHDDPEETDPRHP